MKSNKKVVVALSGGVDSAAAAYLLKKQNYQVIGLYLRLVDNLADSQKAAQKIAKALGIDFFVLDLRKEFEHQIIKYFLSSYEQGLTPNPCVRCNFFIKFKTLLNWAKKKGIYLVSTGHYAKIKRRGDKFELWRARDKDKDQTYFLYTLRQSELSRIIFPLNSFLKKEVEVLVKKISLPVLATESQDICFLHQNGKPIDHNEFLRQNLKLKPGPIKVLDTGEIVGQHQGLPLYTIGQRKGIRIGGIGPFYVADLDYEKNILWVVRQAYDRSLMKDSLTAKRVNWISGRKPRWPLRCQAVIRYGHKAEDCVVEKVDDFRVKVKFDSPQRAITPGQSVVFYHKNKVLGGGEIE